MLANADTANALQETQSLPRFRRIHNSKRLFASLALAAVIPILLFGAWTAYVTAQKDREAARQNVSETAAQVARRLEAELHQELQIAEMLSLSATLDEQDLKLFYREAMRVVQARELWESISLARPDGEQILNTLKPLGETLGRVSDPESLQRAVRTKRPVVGGIGSIGTLSGKRLVSLRIPVLRGSELRYVLSVGLRPDQIAAILGDAGAPSGWLGAVVDASGRIVARTKPAGVDVGSLASAAAREAIARDDPGFYRGMSLEGVELETVYRRLRGTNGWSLHFGIPAADLDAPVSRSLRLLIAGGLGAIAVAFGLGLMTAREISQRRAHETLLSARALRASEHRRALAVHAAQLGTWRWDVSAHQLTGSHRFKSLLDLPVTAHNRAIWNVDQILNRIHPADRRAFLEFGKRCLNSAISAESEFRTTSADGAESWVRFVGRADQTGFSNMNVIHGVIADIDTHKKAEIERAQLLRRLAATQEADRRRISRELHDQVGQTLTGLLLGLKQIEREVAHAQNGTIAEQTRRLQELTNQVSREIHQAASDLRPAALDDLGLYQSLEAYVAEWNSRFGIAVDLQVIGTNERLPSDVETAIFRCVQEALTNVMKHANATTVSIVCERRDNQAIIAIEDDGRGFDVDAVRTTSHAWSSGLGLSGMRERLGLIGGDVYVESKPGGGTTVFLHVPLS